MKAGPQLPALARAHLAAKLSDQPLQSAQSLRERFPELAEPGACFITLTKQGALRGCIGSLVAHRDLAADLIANAEAAAFRDPRFPPVNFEELAQIRVEVSLLSAPQPLPYDSADDLLCKLEPNVHGVILSVGGSRATFLPQVWEQLPSPTEFLSHLCRKAGLAGDCWRHGPQIQLYTVEKYKEETP
ncbi:AmmeMemoRadiSam system protein A [Magnetofaba australis]|uniref:Putative AMMECR1 domain-containing protein n=1 Tax=Magnetofaba australis IT-1 TaxID=1434232 RepID=A0A1Y2K5V7_9PROT|nr:AmmeMemoRadiSam system protein A [Magnetofaba australis]OSM05092.1 putative AMMECR1 domain-containing protein [Magnetofaba australis IT-1]